MSKKFDQIGYQNQWIKENMVHVGGTYPKELVAEFKEACKKLGISQSSVFRNAMEEVIEKADQK